MLNHESLTAAIPARRTRLLRPGVALRIGLALVTLLYVVGPTVIQWMSFANQRVEVAALRQYQATVAAGRDEKPDVASEPLAALFEHSAPDDVRPLVRPALATVANIDVPARQILDIVRAAALRVVQIAIAALLALIITARTSSDHSPRHARPGVRARLLVRRERPPTIGT